MESLTFSQPEPRGGAGTLATSEFLSPSPCSHLVQFYDDHARFLDDLEAYIADGLVAGEGTIVLATSQHLYSLEARLQARGIDLVAARNENRYLPIGAEDALARLLVDGLPDADRFAHLVEDLMRRARGAGRQVRGFGELVAVLWAQGKRDAVRQLETLWCGVCSRGDLTLLCAYPAYGAGVVDDQSLDEIRALHTGVVAG
jgi:hypothetical protein